MSTPKNDPLASEDPRQLALWTRRYAQHRRALHVLILLVAFFVLFASLSGLPRLAGESYRSGNHLVLGLCIAGLISATLLLFWISIPFLGTRWLERVLHSYYRSEGAVAVVAKPSKKKQRIGLVLAVPFGSCILACVALGGAGYLPLVYMMPISALYTVPFLLGLFVLMRPEGGFVAPLWAFLYAAHAVLYLMFPAIRFEGAYDMLNMLLPCAGYGALAAGVSHLYSRIALAKVKRLARTGLGGDGFDG